MNTCPLIYRRARHPIHAIHPINTLYTPHIHPVNTLYTPYIHPIYTLYTPRPSPTDAEQCRLAEVLARYPALGGGSHHDHAAAQAAQSQRQTQEGLQQTQRAGVQTLLFTLHHLSGGRNNTVVAFIFETLNFIGKPLR